MTLLLSRDALVAAAAGRLYDEALAALAEVGPDFYDPGYDVEIAEDLNGSFAEDTDVNHLASIGMALALNMPVIGWQPAVRNAGEDDRADRAARQFANAALVLISDFTAGHIGQQEFTTGLSAAYLRQARNAYLAGKRALGNLAPLTVDDEQVIARTLAAVGLDPNSPTPRASLGGLLAMLVNATNSATPAARRAGVALNDALDSYTKRLMAQLVRRGFTVAQVNLQRDIDRLVNNAATGNAQAQAALAQVAHVADTGQVGIAAQHAAENRRRATIEVQRFEAKMKAARDLLAAEIQAQIAVSEKQVAARLTQIRAQLLDGKIEPAEAAAAVMALLNTRARRAYASGRRLAGIRGPLSDEDLLNIQQEQDDAANDFLAAVPEVAVAGSMIGGIAKMILSPWNLVDPDVAKWLWRKVTGVSNEYNALKNAGERGAFALGGEPAPVVGRPPATDVADVVAPVGPPPPPHPATALESVTQVWWQLDPAAQHCQDCLTLSDKSPYYLEQLNAMGLHPGSGHTQCMTRCRCRLQFDVPAMVCGDVLNGTPPVGDVSTATTCAMPIPVQAVRPVDPDADTVIGDMPDAASDQAFNWDSDITKRIQTVVSQPGLGEGFTWLRRFVRREPDAVTRTFTIPDTGLTYQAVIEDAPDAVRFLTGKMAGDATLEHEFSVHAMQWAAQRAAERGVPLEFDQSLINPGMAQFLRDVGARSSEFTPVADVIRAGAPSAVETIVPVPGFNLPALPDGVTIPKQRYVSNGRGIMQTGFVPSASKADAIERLYAVFPNAALTPKARAGFSLEQIDQIVAKGELFQTIGLDTSLLREIDRLPATSGHAGIAYSGGRLTLKANPGLAGLSTTADSFGDLFAHEYGHLVSREATGHGGALADELENIYWRNEGRLTKYADGDPKEMFSEAFALMTRPGYKAGDVIGDTEAWSLLQDRGIWTPVGRPMHLVSGEPVGQTLGRAIEGLPDPADFQNIKESGVLHQYHPADLVELLKGAPDDQIAAAEQLFRNAVTAWKKDPTVVPNDWYIWNVKGGLFTPGSLDKAPHVPHVAVAPPTLVPTLPGEPYEFKGVGTAAARRQPDFVPAKTLPEVRDRMGDYISGTLDLGPATLDQANDVLARMEALDRLGFKRKPNNLSFSKTLKSKEGNAVSGLTTGRDLQLALPRKPAYPGATVYATTAAPRSIGDVYAHEFGHAVGADSVPMQKIVRDMQKERGKFISGYGEKAAKKDNWEEEAAETFTILTRPGYVVGSQPRDVEFFNGLRSNSVLSKPSPSKYAPSPPKPPTTPFAGDSYDVAGAPTDELAIAGSDVKLNTPLVEWSGVVPVEPPMPTLALTKEAKDALRDKANAAWLGWQDVESGTTPYAIAWGKAETDAATKAGLLVEKLKDGTYYVAGDDAHMAALRKAVDGGLDTGSDQFWIDWLGFTRERLDAIDAYEAAKKSSKSLRAGVIVREPDGRLWFIAPKNQFAGYENTWSKGGVDAGETTAQAAVREVREEMGLSVELDSYLGDFTSTDGGSLTRYYIGHRTGGGPAFASQKETHAIRLGTPEQVRPVLLHYGKLDSRDTAVLDTYLEHEGLPPVAPANPVQDAMAAGTLALPDGGVVGQLPDEYVGKPGLADALARIDSTEASPTATVPTWEHLSEQVPAEGEPGSGVWIQSSKDNPYLWDYAVIFGPDGKPAAISQLGVNHWVDKQGVSQFELLTAEQVRVRPDLAGHGYATQLYDWIQDNTDLNLYSVTGNSVTADGKAFVTSWLKHRQQIERSARDVLGFSTDDLPAKMPPHASPKWAAKEWKPVGDALTVDENHAIDEYVQNAVNSPLGHGKADAGVISTLDALLAKHPLSKDVTVTRGMELSAFDADSVGIIGKKVDIGHVFTSPVYLSTTLDPSLALSVDNIVGQHGAIVHFRVPKGTPAFYMNAVPGVAGDEEELLLARGLSYRATKAEFVPNYSGPGADRWLIDAEILPPANAGKVAAIADHPANTVPSRIGYDVADAEAIAGLYHAVPTTPSGVVKEWKLTTADGDVVVSMMESPLSQNFIAAIDAIQPEEFGGLIAEQQHKTLLAGTLLGVLKNAPAGKKVSVALHDVTDAEILKPLLTATNTVVSIENNLILQPDEVVKVIHALSNGAVEPPGQLSVNAAAAATLAGKLSPVDPQSAAAAAVPSVSTSHFAPGVTNAPEPPKSVAATYGFNYHDYVSASSDASGTTRVVELFEPTMATQTFTRTQSDFAIRLNPDEWTTDGPARKIAVLRALHDDAAVALASPTIERVRFTNNMLDGTNVVDFLHGIGVEPPDSGMWWNIETPELAKLVRALETDTMPVGAPALIPTAALDPAAAAHVVDNTLSHMPTAPGQWANVNVPKTAMSTKYEYGNSVLKQWSDAQPTPIIDTAALQHPPLDQVGTPMKVYDAHTQVYAYGTVPGAEGKITFHWDVATGGNLRINDVVLEGGPGAGAVASAWLAQMRQFATYMKSPQFGKAEHLAVRINSTLLSDPLLMPLGLAKMIEERGLKFSVFGGATLGRKQVIDLDFDLGKDLEAALPAATPEAAVAAAQSVGGAFAVADAQGAVDSATLLAQEWGGVHDVLAKHYQMWAVGPAETHPATIGQGYTDVYFIDPLMPQYRASISYVYPDAFGSPDVVRVSGYVPIGVSDKIVTVAAASTFRNLAKQGKIIEYSPVALGKVSEPLRDLFASYAPTPAGSPGLYRLSAAKVNNALALLDNKVGALVPAAINTPPVVAAPTGFLAKLGTSTDAWHNTAAEWEHTGGGLQMKMTFPSGGYVENGLIGLNDADQWIIHPDIFAINAANDGDHALAYATAVRLFHDGVAQQDLFVSIQTLVNNSPQAQAKQISDLFTQLGAETKLISGPGLSYRLTPDIQQALIDSFEYNALGVVGKAPTTDVYAEMLAAYGMTVPQSSKQMLADSLVTPGKPGAAITPGTGASESLSWTTPLGDMSVDFFVDPIAKSGLLTDVHGANQAEYYAAALLGLDHLDALNKGVIVNSDLVAKLPGLQKVLVDKYGAVDQFGLVQMDAAQVHTLVADLKNGLNLAVPPTPMPNPVTAFGATVAVPVATPPPSAAAGAASGNFALLGPDYNPVLAQQVEKVGNDISLPNHSLLSGTNTTMKISKYAGPGGDTRAVHWRRLGNRVELWHVEDGNPNAFAAWVRDTTHYLNMNPKIEAVVLKAPYQGTVLDPIRSFLSAYKTGGGDLNPVVDRNTWNLMNVQMDKDAIAAAKAPVAAPAHQAFEAVTGYDAQLALNLKSEHTETFKAVWLKGTNTVLKDSNYEGGKHHISWRRLGNGLEIHHVTGSLPAGIEGSANAMLAHIRTMAELMDESPKIERLTFAFPADVAPSLRNVLENLGADYHGDRLVLTREQTLKIRDLIKADAGIVVAPPPIVYSVIGQTLVPEALSYDPKFIAKAVPSDTFTKTASYLSGTNTTIKHTHYVDAADMEWRRLGNRLETWGYYGGPQPALQNATFWAHVRHIANELDASPKLEGWSYKGEIGELPIQIEQLLVNEFGAVQTETGLRMTREQVLKVRQMLDYDLQQVYDLQQGATTAFVPGSVTFTPKPVPKPVPGVPIIVGPQADLMAKVIAYTPKESKTYGNPLLLPPKKIGSQGFSTIKAEWTNYNDITVGNYWPHNAAPYSGEYLPVWLGSLYHIAGRAESLGKDLIIPKTIQGVTDADYQAIILPLLGAANATLEGTSTYNMKYRVASSQASKLRDLLKANELPPGTKPAPAVSAATTAAAASTAYTPPPPQPLPVYKPKPKPLPPTIDINAPIPTLTDIASPTYVPPAVSHTLVSKATGPQIPDAAKLSKQFGYNNIDVQSLLALGSSESEIGELTLPGATKTALARRSSWLTAEGVKVDAQWAASPGGSVVAFTNMLPAPGVSAGQQTASFWASLADFAQKTATKVTDDGAEVTNARMYVTKEIYDSRPELRQMLLDLGGTEFLERPEHGAASGFGAAFDAFGPGIRLDRQQSKVLADALATNTRDVALQGQVLAATPPPPVFKAVPQGVVANQPFRYFGIDPDNLYIAGTEVIRADGLGAVSEWAGGKVQADWLRTPSTLQWRNLRIAGDPTVATVNASVMRSLDSLLEDLATHPGMALDVHEEVWSAVPDVQDLLLKYQGRQVLTHDGLIIRLNAQDAAQLRIDMDNELGALRPAGSTLKPVVPAVIWPDPHELKPFQSKLKGQTRKGEFLDAQGNHWLFKPGASGRGTHADVAVSDLAQLLGLRVPKVREYEFEVDAATARALGVTVPAGKDAVMVRGELQKMVPGVHFTKAVSDLTPDQVDELFQHKVLDWVVANDDAHIENFLIDGEGHLWGIDKTRAWVGMKGSNDTLDPLNHGQGGPGLPPLANLFWRDVRRDPAVLQRITPKAIAKTLGHLNAIPETEFLRAIRPVLGDVKLYPQFHSEEEMRTALVRRLRSAKSDLEQRFKTEIESALKANPSDVPQVWKDWLNDGAVFRPSVTRLEQAEDAMAELDAEFGQYSPSAFSSLITSSVFTPANKHVTTYVHGSGLVSTAAGKAAGAKGYGADVIPLVTPPEIYERYTRLNQWALLHQVLDPRASPAAHDVDISSLRRAWNPDTGTIRVIRGTSGGSSPDAYRKKIERQGLRSMLGTSVGFASPIWGSVALMIDVPWENIYTGGTLRAMLGSGEAEFLVRDVTPDMVVDVRSTSGGRYGNGPWGSFDDFLKFQRPTL